MDILFRTSLVSGWLARSSKEYGLRDVTSNPSLFQKSILPGADHDRQPQSGSGRGASLEKVGLALTL